MDGCGTELKKCSMCSKFKNKCDFVVSSNSKDGRRSSCKECNKPLKQKNSKEYYRKNKEYFKIKRSEETEARKIYDKEYRKKNKERIKAYLRKYREENKSYLKTKRLENKKHLYALNIKYRKSQYHTNINYRLKHSISCQIRNSIKKTQATSKYLNCFGYTIQDLRAHISKQFTKGMSWDNYGEWHLDHIRPQCSFDFTDDNQLKECWALTNLRPLWAKENALKAGKKHFLI